MSRGKRIGEAIAEIEAGRMAAALAVVAIGLAGDPGLALGDRLD